MKKNILFFTALKANDPNMMAYKEWSLKTWEYYAKQHNCELFILEDPLYDTEWMRPTWQRWYVYDLLEVNNIKYDQVALIDIDTMVRWDTPDIFKLSNNQYSAVRDDVSLEWVNNSLTGYKKFFPNVDLEWTEYVNNGIIILPKNGKEFCNKVKQFYLDNVDELRDLQHNSLKKGTDQTPVNYLAVEHFGDNINHISKKFNWGHLHTTHGLLQCMVSNKPIFLQFGYIWHFNGLPREQRNGLMKQTWDIIKDNYIIENRNENKLDTICKKYGGTTTTLHRGRNRIHTGGDASKLGYTKVYFEKFSHLQSKPINFLEIGIFQGKSLALWSEFFTNGKIYGIDIDTTEYNLSKEKLMSEYNAFSNNNIQKIFETNTCEKDQNVLDELPMIDILIDDGAHDHKSQHSTFINYFSKVNSGGMYVIEDIRQFELIDIMQKTISETPFSAYVDNMEVFDFDHDHKLIVITKK